jgi:hypothetical protein
MPSLLVIEALDVIEHFRFNLRASLKLFSVNGFDLEVSKEAFHHSIVSAVSYSTHAQRAVAVFKYLMEEF